MICLEWRGILCFLRISFENAGFKEQSYKQAQGFTTNLQEQYVYVTFGH